MAIREDSIFSISNLSAKDASISATPGSEDRILVAQADTGTGTDGTEVPVRVEIALEDGPIARLPEGTDIANPQLVGTELQFVQPDGSIVAIPNGAVAGLILFIGEIEIPPETVALLFSENEIETAAGPENTPPEGAHGNYQTPGQQSVGESGFEQNNLLDNSESEGGGGAGTFAGVLVSNLAPALAVAATTGRLSEEGFGNADTVGDADETDAAEITGTIGVDDADPLTFAFGAPDGTYSSGGETIVWTVAGGTLIGTAGATTVLTAIISDAGDYIITLSAPFDHPDPTTEDEIALELPVTVTDTGGISIATSIPLVIEDDAPIVVSPQSSTVDEDDLSVASGDLADGNNDNAPGDAETESNAGLDGDDDDTTVAGDLGISWGGDDGNSDVDGGVSSGNGDRAVAFAATAIATLEALELTSRGEGLSYTLNAAQNELTATSDDGRTVFKVSLSDEGSGSYLFDLEDVLDHVGQDDSETEDATEVGFEDDITLTFDFTATDGDGDAVSASFTVLVDDDMPAMTAAATEIAVDEDDIYMPLWGSAGTSPFDSEGSSTGETDTPPGGPAYAAGSIAATVSFGADGEAGTDRFAFAADATTTMQDLGLMSKGESLVYDVVDSANYGYFIIGYVDEGSGDYVFGSGDRAVFSLTLDRETGEFVYRQFEQFDHVDDGNNDKNTDLVANGGSIPALDLGAIIEAKDGDGDAIALTGKLLVTINDDIPDPEITIVDYVRVDETYGAHSDNVYNPFTRSYHPAVVAHFADIVDTGSDDDVPGPIYARYDVIDTKTNVGADDNATMSLSLQIDAGDDTDSGLRTTEGETIHLFAEADNLIVGRIDGGANDGKAAFAIHIDTLGRISIVQYISLSHPDPTSSDEYVSLADKLTAAITVTDHDGDTVTSTIAIPADVITFDDDGPSTGANRVVWLDEDDLENGIGDSASGDNPARTPLNADGTLNLDFGADGGTVAWLDTVDAFGGGTGFTYDVDGTTGTLTITQDQNGTDVVVLTVTLNQDTGAYSVTQDAPIVHATGDTENNQAFWLTYRVTDGDGDTEDGVLRVNVDDDMLVIGDVEDGTVDEDGHLLGNAGDSYPDNNPAGTAGDVAGENTRTTGSLGIAWGADNTDAADSSTDVLGLTTVPRQDGVVFGDDTPSADMARAVWFSDTDITAMGANGEIATLSSRGEDLTYQLVESGTRIIAWAGIRPVFTVALSDDDSGSYTFQLFDTLDHPVSNTEDTIDLTFSFTARDFDGDEATSAFTVSVNDDAPVASLSLDSSVRIDESDDGSGDNLGGIAKLIAAPIINALVSNRGSDPDMDPVYAYDHAVDFSIDYGADSYGGFDLALQIVGGNGVDSGLDTTEGDDIYLYREDGIVVGRVGGSGGDAAFALILDPTGGLSVAQYLSLAHPDGTDADDSVDLDGKIQTVLTAEDGDGDEAVITLDIGDRIRFDDDGPEVSDNGRTTAVVDEDDIAAISGAQHAGTDGAAATLVATGTIGKIDLGSDGFGSAQFDSLNVRGTSFNETVAAIAETADIGLDTGLTSDGQVVNIRLDSPTQMTAFIVSTSETVFTVELDGANLGYTVTVLRNIDHGADNGNRQRFDFTVRVEDGDGDPAFPILRVNLKDDAPVAMGATSASVTEDAAVYTGDLTSVTTGAVDLGINWGADDGNAGGTNDRSVAFAAALTGTAVMTDGGTALTSNGAEVTYNWVDAQTLQGVADGRVIFEVTLNDTDSGSYTFELLDNVDHVGAGEDASLDLGFDVTATDSDGDTDLAHFTVTINDDAGAPAIGSGGPGTIMFADDFDTATDVDDTGFLDSTNGGDGLVEIFDSGTGGYTTPGGGKYALLTQVAGDAPFTRFEGYQTDFGTGFTSSVAVYLAPGAWTDGEGFDYSVAATQQNGDHLRDYIFHVTQDSSSGQLLIGGSNNTNFDPREDLETINHYEVETAGWYTFEHVFRDAGDGSLAVDLNLYNQDGVLVFTETRTNPADLIDTIVGGHRYGWFTNIDVAGGIAVDNLSMTATSAAPVAMATAEATDGAGAFDPSTVSGLLGIDWGPDSYDEQEQGTVLNGVDRSVAFGGIVDGAAVLSSNNTALESGGYAITWNIVSDTHVEGVANGATVFEITLDDGAVATDQGSYSFTLLAPIDHVEGTTEDDVVVLDIGFAATDADGDSATGTFSVSLTDDGPVVGDPQSAAVAEDSVAIDLVNGSFEAKSLADGEPGVISHSKGNYTTSAPDGWAIAGQGGLFAPTDVISAVTGHAGDAVVWLRNGATLSQDTGETISADGSYTLTLNIGDRSDQPWPGGDVRIIAVNGGSSVVLAAATLPVPTNGQWETVTLETGPIDPAYAGYELRVEVQQGAAGSGNQILVDDIELSRFVGDSDAGSLDIDWGADDTDAAGVAGLDDGVGRSVAFDPSSAAPVGLTADGEQLVYTLSENGTLLTATKDVTGTIVFTVALNDDDAGAYQFELFGNIDHPDSGADPLELNFDIVATDSDGDADTGSFAVTVNDDIPLVGAVPLAPSVDEDDFVGSPSHTTTVSGDFAFDWGADGARSLTFGTAPGFAGGAPLTSNGKTVNFVQLGTMLVAYIGDTEPGSASDASVVFTLEPDTAAGGSYVFTLRRPIDHTGDPGEAFALEFTATATDGDGDTVIQDFAINVDPAGDIGSIDYSNFDTGVFVNLSDNPATAPLDTQEVAGNTATDRDGVNTPSVGEDNVEGIVDAIGGSGDDVLIGDGTANTLDGNEGADQLVGGGGNDVLTGDGGNDHLDGGTGDDRMSGGAGDDTMIGGAGDDLFFVNGGNDSVYGNGTDLGDPDTIQAVFGENDTIVIYDNQADYDITRNANGSWDVENRSTGETDTLFGIEGIDFGGGGVDLDLTAGVFVFDASGNLVSTHGTIADAIGASSTLEGYTVEIHEGSYAENLSIGKALNFVGTGNVSIDVTSGTAVNITNGSGQNVSFDNIDINGGGSASTGISIAAGAGVATLTFNGGSISGFKDRGISSTDNADPAHPAMDAIVVSNASFSNNGTSTNNTAHVKLFGYSGDATFQTVTFTGLATGQRPDSAVEITGGLSSPGHANPAPANAPDIGNVVFDGVTVTGGYDKNPIAIYNFGEIDGLSIPASGGGLDLSGATSGWGPLFNIDGVTDSQIDASVYNITLPGGSGIETELQGEKDGQSGVDQTIIGTDGNDRIMGKLGNDTLKGGDGDDELYGADKPGQPLQNEFGNDTLEGGAGNDALIGGAGLDTAVYNGVLDAGDFTTIADADPTGGVIPGWRIDATGFGEGTDTLTGVQIVQGTDPDAIGTGESGTFLLVGNGGFATIQAAVDAAHAGDTILIASGTYSEQVQIEGAGKDNVSLIAIDGPGSVIIAPPASLEVTATSPNGGRDLVALVSVEGADNVTLSGISVDGQQQGNVSSLSPNRPSYIGISFIDSDGGLIDGASVTGIRENDAGFGNQRNSAIYVNNTDGDAIATPANADLAGLNSIEIRNTTVTNFQKGGIVVVNANVDIHDNIITGIGSTGWTAQNGIQVSGSTGSISGNDVSAIGYAGTSAAASLILTFSNNGLVIDDNTLNGTGTTDYTLGVAVIDSIGAVVTNNDFSNILWPLDVEDYVNSSWPEALLPGVGTVFSGNTFVNTGTENLYFVPDAATTAPFSVNGTDGTDVIYGGAGNDTLQGGGGDDYLLGRDGADYLQGNTGNDELYGGEGDDTLRGGKNDDYISGDGGNDTIFGDRGDDTIVWRIGDGNDVIDGGEDDEIAGDTLQVINATDAAQTLTFDAPNPTGFEINSGTETVTVDNVEEVELTLSDKGDTVNFTGSFAASGVNVSTFTVEGGDGNDEVDASDITSGHRVVFNGNGGDDIFHSGAGNDEFDGGEGTDTLVLKGNLSDYTVTLNADGSLTIVDEKPGTDGEDGTDHASATVEMVSFDAGGTLDMTASVRVFAGSSNVLRGTYGSIQDAIDAASTSTGDTVKIDAGSFNEKVNVTKSLTIIGIGDEADPNANTVLTGPGKGTGTGFAINADNVTIENLRVEGYDYGLSLGNGRSNLTINGATVTGNDVGMKTGSTVQFDGISVTGSHFDGNDYGFYLANDGNGSRIQNVTVLRTSFDNNLNAAVYGETLETASFSEVTAVNSGTGSANGVVFDFWSTYASTFANIIFDGFTIDNSETTPASSAFRFSTHSIATDANGITLQNGSVENVVRVLRTTEPDSAFTINNVSIGTQAGAFSGPNGPLGPFVSMIEGDFGSDVLTGDRFSSGDNDVIFGDFYDTYLGGYPAGDDTLSGGGGNDLIFGGGGNDTIDGGSGDDTIVWNAGDGNDTVDGGSEVNADTLQVTNFDPSLGPNGPHGTRQVDFTVSVGGNTIAPATDDIVVTAKSGATTETTTIDEVEDITFTLGDAGDSVDINGDFSTTALDTSTITVHGGAGNDDVDASGITSSHGIVAYGAGGDDSLTGGAGDDELHGGADNDTLSGRAGADTLWGDAGDDTLTGGDGDDILRGGEGSDTYRVGWQDGFDTFEDSGASGIDQIVATSNVAAIGVKGDFSNALTGIEEIHGIAGGNNRVLGDSDGNTLDFTGMAVTNAKIDGGGGDDNITGTTSDDIIVGGDGDDTLDGAAGSDTYQVGWQDGFDTFEDSGASGIDRIVATSNVAAIGVKGDFSQALTGIEEIHGVAGGSNRVLGDGNANTLDFSGMLVSDAKLDGGGGDDTITGTGAGDAIVGGDGDDKLDGGEGSDTYQISWQDGFDTYRDTGSASDIDRILVTYNNASVGIEGDFSNELTGIEVIDANNKGTVRVFGNSDGNSFDFRDVQLINGVIIDAAGGDDTVTTSQTTSDHVTYKGGSGTDTLRIALTLDQAADTTLISQIDAVIAAGSGSVNAGGLDFTVEGFETIIKGVTVGDSFLPFDKVLLGNANHNTLDVDTVNGGAPTNEAYLVLGRGGNDVITGSDGNDILVGEGGLDTMTGGLGNDTFLVGPGDGEDHFFGDDGTDRILARADNTEISIRKDFGAANSVEEISANGFTGVTVHGSADHNVLDFSGTALTGISTIDGEGGNDTITGTAENETIIGGTGDDVLHGGDGDDTFEIGLGNGDDTFDGDAGINRIVATEDNVEIGIRKTFNALSDIQEISANGFNGVTLHGSWDHNTLDFSATTLTGITTIDGEGGDDVITGTDNSETIIGGAGGDTMHGGGGNDTFDIGLGSGFDTFDGGDDDDRIVATEDNAQIGIAKNFVAGAVERIDANTHSGVAIQGSGDHNTMDFSATQLTGIEAIRGGAGSDVITGSSGNDTIIGDTYNDTLFGGAGDDTFVWSTGDGSDRIEGGTEMHRDTLVINNTGASPANYVISAASSSGNIVPQAPGVDAVDILVSDGTDTIRMDEVEDIVVNLGVGGSVSFGPGLENTALETSTVYVNGGNGNDTVDLTNMPDGYNVVFNGGGGNDQVIFGDNEAAFERTNNPDGTVTFAPAGGGTGPTATIDFGVNTAVFADGPVEIKPVWVIDSADNVTEFDTIEAAIAAAGDGDTVRIAAGTYTLTNQLTIGDEITIIGAGEGSVTIKTAGTSWGVLVEANNVSISDLTIDASATTTYGLKVQPANPDPASSITGFTLENATVQGAHRSEIDLNGVDNSTLRNVTADGMGTGGVGIALSDSTGISLENITTTGNGWGSIGLYSKGAFYEPGTNGISFSGTYTHAEPVGIYAEEENGSSVENITFGSFASGEVFAIYNDVYRGAGSENFTHFFDNEADAISFALALNGSTNAASVVTGPMPVTGVDAELGSNFVVAPGMSIQEAIDQANAGDTIFVKAGTYYEQLQIEGAGKDNISIVAVDGPGSVTIAPPANMVVTAVSPTSGYDLVALVSVEGADNVTLKDITIDGEEAGNVSGVSSNGPRFFGITYIDSSGGLIDGVTVTSIRESDAGFGNQRNVGIYVANADTDAIATPSAADLASLNDIEIRNSTVTNFQKGGIVVVNADVDIHGNTVTGIGGTSWTAQNGIQISGSTGTVSGNTISGIGYTGEGWAASLILAYYNNGLIIDGNSLDGSGSGDLILGVAAIDSIGAVITNNAFSNITWPLDVEDYTTWPGTLLQGSGVDFNGNSFVSVGSENLYFVPDEATLSPFSVTGTQGTDVIYGGAGDDTLQGAGGDDYLIGSAGNDILTGGEGDDLLIGGLGLDTLTGGEGVDTFVIDQTDFADIITDYDFANGFGDKVDLSELLDAAINQGNADEYVQFSQADGSVKVDADGAGGEDAVTVAMIDNHSSVTDLTVMIDNVEVIIHES